MTELWEAARTGDAATLELILSSMELNVDSLKPPENTSALYVAAQNGHFDCCKKLLQHGANPNVGRGTGATPLFIATQKDRIEVARLLLDFRADVTLENEQRATPFTLACCMNNLQFVELLLDAGSNIHHTATGLTPLQWASQNKGDRCVRRFLLERLLQQLNRKFCFQRWRRMCEKPLPVPLSYSDLRSVEVAQFPFDLLPVETQPIEHRRPANHPIKITTEVPAINPPQVSLSDDTPKRRNIKSSLIQPKPSFTHRAPGNLVQSVRKAEELLNFVHSPDRGVLQEKFLTEMVRTPKSKSRGSQQNDDRSLRLAAKLKSSPLYR
jgi:hypothetical protein